MQTNKPNKYKLLLLPIILAGVFFAQTAMAQKLPETTPECDNLKQWFDVQLRDNKKTNAVEDLPIICTAQGAFMWFIQMLLLFAGSVAVIFIIIGGFKYLTSAGNEEQSEQGKKTLVTSIIGLVVVIMAATIVRIVATTLGTGKADSNAPNPSAQQTPADNQTPTNPQDPQLPLQPDPQSPR
ncbi:MAG: pilin [Patescibacteria group bacterium]|mgnify:CR=1 FL=1